MENLVPLGTGNSRLMKSNIPSNTTLAQLIQMWNNGTFPYDIGPLNSAGISQQGTPLNKATLLKDATAALFGLTNTAVPDEVLAWVGKYAQHWWQRYSISYKATVSDSHIREYNLVTGTSKSSTISVKYGDSVSADASGNIVIENEQTVSVSWNTYTNFSPVFGKYFRDPNNNKVYKWSSQTNFNRGDLGGTYYLYLYYVNEVFSEKEYTKDTFVQSSSESAYPEAGEENGYYYQYLGIPFDNAITAPKIATGSYVGTGTYGASNPNTLTFDFEPKIVFLARDGSEEILGNYAGHITVFPWTAYLTFRSGSSGYRCTINWNGNTISWYSTSDATSQGNVSGTTYYYLAIG